MIIEVLKSELRNYVEAQFEYFADSITFAVAVQHLQFASSMGATVLILTASDSGHTAIATHARVPGLVCGIWVGAGPIPPLLTGAREEEPSCPIPQ